MLKREGAWFGERKWDEKTAPESGENKENSLETNKQQAETLRGGIHSVDAFSSKVVMVDPTKGLREFEFDSVLPDKSSQGTVYESSARRLVSSK